MVSVVGAREIQDWVMEWMENELAPALRQCGLGVVSGGARGVDQMAHRIALRYDLPTVIVLPSGLGKLYPKNLEGWRGRKNLLFMTEYAEDQPMRKHHFFLRNRLVVGLTNLTLVIQAKERSGTMISARFAADMGKTIATLPAFPVASAFSGNNQLIYEGAMVVRGEKDLVALFNSNFCASKKVPLVEG